MVLSTSCFEELLHVVIVDVKRYMKEAHQKSLEMLHQHMSDISPRCPISFGTHGYASIRDGLKKSSKIGPSSTSTRVLQTGSLHCVNNQKFPEIWSHNLSASHLKKHRFPSFLHIWLSITWLHHTFEVPRRWMSTHHNFSFRPLEKPQHEVMSPQGDFRAEVSGGWSFRNPTVALCWMLLGFCIFILYHPISHFSFSLLGDFHRSQVFDMMTSPPFCRYNTSILVEHQARGKIIQFHRLPQAYFYRRNHRNFRPKSQPIFMT